jgi:hypothetical protein
MDLISHQESDLDSPFLSELDMDLDLDLELFQEPIRPARMDVS